MTKMSTINSFNFCSSLKKKIRFDFVIVRFFFGQKDCILMMMWIIGIKPMILLYYLSNVLCRLIFYSALFYKTSVNTKYKLTTHLYLL